MDPKQEEKLHFPSCLWNQLPVTFNVPTSFTRKRKGHFRFCNPWVPAAFIGPSGPYSEAPPLLGSFWKDSFDLDRVGQVIPGRREGSRAVCCTGPVDPVPAGSGSRSEGPSPNTDVLLFFSLLSQCPRLLRVSHGGYDPERPPRGGCCGK